MGSNWVTDLYKDYQAESNSWTFLEVDVSIICASLPILKAPLQRLLPRVFGMKSSAEKSADYSKSPSYRAGVEGPSIAMNNSRRSGLHAKSDTASDEEQMIESGGIMKTTNVTLDYEEVDLDKDSERKHGRREFDFFS